MNAIPTGHVPILHILKAWSLLLLIVLTPAAVVYGGIATLIWWLT